MPFAIRTETRAVVRGWSDDWETVVLVTVNDSEAEDALVAAAVVVIDDEHTGGTGDLYEFRITATYEKEEN